MGSLSSNGLKGKIGIEWSELKTQNSTIIKNNFSQQQFHIFSIPNLEVNNLKLYFSREFSSLPKTPKIICLQKHSDRLLILTEKGDKFISQWLSEIHCELSILLKLKDTISAVNALKNKFGPFLITEKMINVSANDNILVWYNQKYESNLVQLPLFSEQKKGQNQQIMVQNIIEIFRKSYTKHFDMNSLIPHSSTFVEFKNNVKSRIQEIQSPFGSRNQSRKSTKDEGSTKRSLTPNSQQSQNIQYQKMPINTSESQNFGHKQRKSDHVPAIRILQEKQPKATHNTKQKRHISFLQDQAHKSHKTQINIKIPKQKPLSSLQEQSSQNSSSSNISSAELRNEKIVDDKYSRSYNCIKQQDYTTKQQLESRKIFKRKQFKFKTYNVGECKSNVMNIRLSPSKDNPQKCTSVREYEQQTSTKFVQTSVKFIEPYNNLYKGCESFSSKKNFSLKSTTGTLKKTRQFLQNIRQLLEQHQTIREQSDQTHKNSNNYSIESIKDMKASVSLSQDFNKLFSMADSVASGLEDFMREKEFEKILFENA